MRTDRFELPLRIVVQDPVPGLAIALQRGAASKAELVGLSMSSGEPLAFDLEVTVKGSLADSRPRLLGLYVQGPPAERFFYLCVGKMAGQADSGFGGRVKVPLGGLTWRLIKDLPQAGRLEALISGRRGDCPALATVPLLAPGWRAISP
jgi:hypothetical protein